MQKKRGRISSSTKLDCRELFEFVWLALELTCQYEQILAVGLKPPRDLTKRLRGFAKDLTRHSTNSMFCAEAFERECMNLELLMKLQAPLAQLYKFKKKNPHKSFRKEISLLLPRKMIIGEQILLPQEISRISQLLDLSAPEISRKGGPVIAAKVALGQALKIGSRRGIDKKIKSARASAQSFPSETVDQFISGYSSAQKICALLKSIGYKSSHLERVAIALQGNQ